MTDSLTETPDAHMVETLRLRTAALHRVIGSNDQLRRENDDLRARLARIELLAYEAEARADRQPPLFNGARFPATIDALDVLATLNGAP